MATDIDDILRQREELKRRDPDTILLFRVEDKDGDFYRVYGDDIRDAKDATYPDMWRHSRHYYSWVGWPPESLEGLMACIVKAGKRAEVCERATGPAPAVAKVERIATKGQINPVDQPRRKPWYVGAQNDGLYIIDQPPRPSNDDPHHDRDCRVVAKVYQQPGEAEVAAMLAAAPRLLAACRDQAAWIERLLQVLEHRTTYDQRGHPTNGFAFAAAPDWELRQKLESLREDIAEAAIREAEGDQKREG